MFDVQAQNDNIAITQINTRYSHTEQCDVKIWTKVSIWYSRLHKQGGFSKLGDSRAALLKARSSI